MSHQETPVSIADFIDDHALIGDACYHEWTRNNSPTEPCEDLTFE